MLWHGKNLVADSEGVFNYEEGACFGGDGDMSERLLPFEARPGAD